jgi:CHASE2 domain-containing sensor protein
MTKCLLLLVGLILSLSCKEKDSLITIVDVGHLDRVGIAKQLSIVNKYSPKVIGFDFLLTTDSLDKDISISKEIDMTKNLVQASKLHDFVGHLNYFLLLLQGMKTNISTYRLLPAGTRVG